MIFHNIFIIVVVGVVKIKDEISCMVEERKKSKHIESEVSGLINDSWSCLVVWFYKNKLLASRQKKKKLFSRSHNQVQGNKSRRGN